MRRNSAVALGLAVLGILIAGTASAQQSGTVGGATISSEPGKAKIVQTVQISAEIVGVDRATRTLMLKGPGGKAVNVVAGEEVANFDQIKLGDFVVVRYTEALALELRKNKTTDMDVTVREGSSEAKPGERPSVSGEREVSAVATVVDVDQQKSTITLQGPDGNLVELDVLNPAQFKVVKKGDQVDVKYTKALALSVEPAAAPPKKN
jgi:hypothetical protein